MSYNLYLDDFRQPWESNAPVYTLNEWKIVRSYQEFVSYIIEFGIPQLISFDHDLGDEHMMLCNARFTDWNKYYEEENREMTGYDCAKWLITYCLNNKANLPVCLVHSANPVGTENIRLLLKSAKEKLFI